MLCDAKLAHAKPKMTIGFPSIQLWVMALDQDNDLKWLMERSHNAYLRWIVLWLACLLAVVDVLMGLISSKTLLATFSYTVIVIILYVGLVFGMIFSVYRLCNTAKEHMGLATQLKNEFLREKIISDRGRLSKWLVDNEGKLCSMNRNIAIVFHLILSAVLLLLSFLPEILK